jgi:hypothetical protein
MSHVHIIVEPQRIYNGKIKTIVQFKPKYKNRQVVLWIDHSENNMANRIDQDNEIYLKIKVRRALLKAKNIPTQLCVKPYKLSDKKEIKKILTVLNEIYLNRVRKIKTADQNFIQKLEKLIKDMEAESKREFPVIGLESLRSRNSTIMTKWSELVQKHAKLITQ